MNQHQLEEMLNNRMVANLNTNSLAFRRIRQRLREVQRNVVLRANRYRNKFLAFDEIHSPYSTYAILYRREIEQSYVLESHRRQIDTLVVAYLALLYATIALVIEQTIEEMVVELGIEDDVETITFLRGQVLQNYTDFNTLWALNTKQLNERLDDIILNHAFADNFEKLIDDSFNNFNFKLNRTWVTALADSSNKSVESVTNHLGLEFARWSDYAERFGDDGRVCADCHARSNGGLLGQGIYRTSEIGGLLHPHCRCIIQPITSPDLIQRLNELSRA